MTRTPLAMLNSPAAMTVRADRMAAACLSRDDLDGFRRNLDRAAAFACLPDFDEVEYEALRRRFGS